jgi:hypothetical protein
LTASQTPKSNSQPRRPNWGGATFAVLQAAIAKAEKSQAANTKLANTGYKNSTSQQQIKTSAVDNYEMADEADAEVATFKGKGKGKGKRKGKQEPVPEPQQSTSGDQGKKTMKKPDFSKPPMTPCWECHQMGHWSHNCPIKTQMMAQFMQQNGGAGAMPLNQTLVGPDNGQWSGNAKVGWM